jgi:hypothetical protein
LWLLRSLVALAQILRAYAFSQFGASAEDTHLPTRKDNIHRRA